MITETIAEQPASTQHFKPRLGLLDATMIVAGSMVGSGIFIVSSYMVQDVGSAGWLIFAWVLTALMTVAAALSFVELSALFPKAGGTYIYLKEAYNPLIGFLYGWSFFTVIQTGMIAAVGVSFSKFAAFIFPSLSESNIILHTPFIDVSAAQIFGIIQIIFLSSAFAISPRAWPVRNPSGMAKPKPTFLRDGIIPRRPRHCYRQNSTGCINHHKPADAACFDCLRACAGI